MLELLHIENIAIIEAADIEFAPGFNALTGETGAGKSIVIDSLSAVLGQRTSRELIRTGADKAFVSAAFSGVEPGLTEALGIQPEPDGKGGYRYAVSARMPKLNFEEKLQTIFRECVLSAENAQNLAVIKTMNGMANAAAFALDSMEDTDIVGTLAGDDTVLLVFHDSAHAADFCEQVRLMLH